MRRMTVTILTLLLFVSCKSSSLVYAPARDQIPASSPMMTDSAGHSGQTAAQSVFRIECSKKKKGGSAFLHKSGNIITAAHIVAGSQATDIFVIDRKGNKVGIQNVIVNMDLDLALLTPWKKLKARCLPISSASNLAIGSQVSTWGYPSGYYSTNPLLSVGYLSGENPIKAPSGKMTKQWVVNIAINLGNSGGPLVHVESGKVIGVVSSKITPLPDIIQKELDILSKQKDGFQYTKTEADGSVQSRSEGQIVAEVLYYLRSQVQLVMGHVVTLAQLRAFLEANEIEP